MNPPKTLIKYLALKISVIAIVISGILFQRMLSFWYDPTSDIEVVKRQLSEEKVNPNERNESGLTPLMLAAAEGNVELVNLLLTYGAHVNAQAGKDPLLPDNEGKIPLHFAVMNGNPDVIRSLLAHGANPLLKDVYGNIPLHYLSYVGNPDIQLEMFDALMQANSNLNIQNNENATPLHWMVEQDNADIIGKAASDYGDFINYSLKNNGGYTLTAFIQALGKDPITNALAQALGKEVTPDFLDTISNTSWGLEFGQDVNERNAKGYAGVHIAAIQGNPDYMQELIDKKADLSLKDPKYGSSPLHLAATYGFVDVVRLLLRNKAPVTVTNNNGQTVLMALLGIRSLIDRAGFIQEAVDQGAHINAQDNQGNTLLHYSVMTGDVEWIKMLLRQFGNIIDRSLKNNAGKTALDIAKERNYGDIVSLLSPQ